MGTMKNRERSELLNGNTNVHAPEGAVTANGNHTNGTKTEEKYELKVYPTRWIVVALFVFYSATSTFQWVQYAIISNIVARYYDVSLVAVDWTSMCYMLFVVILIVPGSYFSEKIGLRWTMLLGCGLCCIGAWIKVFSVRPDLFWLTFLGQSLVGLTQVFILITPSRLAATWFDSRQLSTGTAVSICGNQLGVAAGFLLTPFIVRNHESLDDIGNDLSTLFWAVAIFTSVITILVLIFFKDEPRLPPSETRALQRANSSANKESFVEPLKRLFTNKSFLILCNAYALNVGVLSTVSTLLNQIYLHHFANGEREAGVLGLIVIATGIVGSIVFGIILDKTKKFKGTTVTVYFLSLLGQILFATAMWCEVKWMVYLAATFLGIFLTGYLAVGYEMCAEYTFPEAESISTGILNVVCNVYGIILVMISAVLMEKYGDTGAHICHTVALTAGLVMTVMTKDETRREDARKAAMYSAVKTNEELI